MHKHRSRRFFSPETEASDWTHRQASLVAVEAAQTCWRAGVRRPASASPLYLSPLVEIWLPDTN